MICGPFINNIKCSKNNFYDLSAEDIRGKTVKFDKFRGKVLLIVNVATYCGFTSSNYPDLVKMQDILGHDGLFQILGFPCNQFGEQEPDTNREIEEFVTEIYKVNFPIFSKSDVIGKDANPVFKHLKEQTKTEPNWNFWKYLVDSQGKVINQWEPEVPLEEIFPAVEEEINKARSLKIGSKSDL